MSISINTLFDNKIYLSQAKIKNGPGQLEDYFLPLAQYLTIIVEKHSTGRLLQLPVQSSDSFQLHPGKILLGVHPTCEGEEQGGGRGTVLLHLGSQLQAGKTKQLNLISVKIHTTEDLVKIGNS